MKNINKLYFLLLLAVSLTIVSSCTKEVNNVTSPSSSPQVTKAEPELGASNVLITLTGSGLGSIRSVVFSKDSVSASFNPILNTGNALMFRIPTDAIPGEQDIIITNSLGVAVKVPFNVLGLATIIDVSDYNFEANSQLTLTGKNLNDVDRVVFNGTTTEIEIISKTATQLVLKFPATVLNSAKLDIYNLAGRITTTQEFVNIANAFHIFIDNYENGFENASWGPASVSNTVSKRGSASFMATYNQGNWSADGFANWNDGLTYSADYKFLSFWIKGGLIDHTFYITGDQRAGGYGNSDRSMPILVPANVWTYYKIKMSDLELWKKGNVFKQLGWWIPGPDNANETIYFDDVILIK